MQIAGYHACKEKLCEYIEPVLTVDFYAVLMYPGDAVNQIVDAFDLKATRETRLAAMAFIDPKKRNV